MLNFTVGIHFPGPTKHCFLKVFELDDNSFKVMKTFILTKMQKHI
jgi:hypothetical protein